MKKKINTLCISKKCKQVLFVLLLISIVAYPITTVWKNSAYYFSKGYSAKYESLKTKYYASQYANKKHTNFIADEELEAFAGGIFLHGINPILIVHDQPPLGRYLISLSIFLFDNEKTIPLFLLLISPVGLYLIANILLKNKFLSLIPVGIFINQQIFLHKFLYMPLLEPIQLPFIIFAMYTCIRGMQSKKYLRWLALTTLCLGFVISIRYFVLGAALISSFFFCLFLQKKIKMAITLVCLLSISCITLLLSYFQTFRSGYSLIKVLGIQKYIFMYHKSAFVHPLSFWDLLLFNRWHTWWGNNAILSDAEWNIFWPISIASIVIFLIFVFLKKMKIHLGELVLLVWLLFYSLMLSVGYTSTRYFLPFVPFLYILVTSFIVHAGTQYKQRKNI